MTEPIVVVGAGGFGRDVLDVIDAINAQTPTWTIIGVIDDHPSEENLGLLKRRGISYLGGLDAHAHLQPCFYTVGIGSPIVRKNIADHMDASSFAAATLIHPTATTGFDVEIGDGTILCAGVRVTTNISLGRHVHINLNATVGHDTTIGNFVSLNPLASVSGDCVIEDGALIGVSGVILNQVRVGANSTVGGSACVVRDVEPNTVVKGVPAR